MKKILLVLSLVLLFSCEKPSDCVESLGDITTKEVAVTPFTRIEIHKGIELIVTQGPEYKVVIETGENIIDDIEVTQSGNILSCRNNNTCNWVREYGVTKVYVTAPDLSDIYSKSERNVSSVGVLTYPVLRLFSLDKDGDGLEGAGTGDFFINVNNSQLVIQTNNVSRFYISGATTQGLFEFYAGDSRIEAQDLTIQNLEVFHRGSNDMIVKPIQSITGKMVSTGNIVLKNNPPLVDVQQLYQGQVIYN
ncbi:head GIN domain-containing protein [Flavobacterium sp.]|uniref:head GIN domain-containing protein n=1 Tax=Flavobacterium sp. TaxID=239 RepID=UPI002B4B152E|nr:head GIN domain-containing protein [Flavobacterium sp.]HLP65629.1 head GIN domain-containing protein [Flavobacterium sp.]